jgi:D-3-phosphoglycerate dehydrogenase
MDTEMKNGIWDKIPGFALSEATFGIIGVGNIGSAVAKRVHSFGAKILGCDLKEISKDLINETKIKQVPLEALLKECDIISLNTDLNPSSEHLINKKTLELMKPSAYLINTSRGPVVNETDLIDALKNKKLAGAGLDVFEHEPLPKNSELLKMKNVFIAPHNSNSSPRAWENVHLNTLNNLFRELGVL